MPVPGQHDDHEEFHEIQERDRDRERGPKSKTSASKSKDLSHVPCKFFKVGSCTAGASCPFSHSVLEPGQHKDTCAWFVKGNCKFGHKCALAHILPGQSLAMDRKNKKAAQTAAKNGGGGTGRDGGDRERVGGRTHKSSSGGHGSGRSERDAHSSDAHVGPTASAGRGGGLLSGSTAPTRILAGTSSRAPISMSLKATISPSAPAPPLKDTDFASFGLPDESNKLPSAPAAQGRPSQSPATEKRLAEPLADDPAPKANKAASADNLDEATQQREQERQKSSPSPLPFNTPRPPASSSSTGPSASDLGPIGSSSRSYVGSPPLSQASRSAFNGRADEGFSPGTSPREQPYLQPPAHSSVPANVFLSSSPFNKGIQGRFFDTHGEGEDSRLSPHMGTVEVGASEEDDVRARPGLAMSLGATRTWRGELGPNPPPSAPPASTKHSQFERGDKGDTAVLDEDLEEFIPSSLSDLLTPEERSRRYSRTGGSVAPSAPAGWTPVAPAQRPSLETHHHRYSRSVPAPSLLGDIKSIWSDTQIAHHPGSAALSSSPSNPPLIQGATGIPGSYKSNGYGGVDGMQLNGAGGLPMSISPSSSFLSPSNASAAFLPSIHQHHQHFLSNRSALNTLRPLTSASNNNSSSATSANITASPSANAAQLLARLTGGDTNMGMSASPPPATSSASLHQTFLPPGISQSSFGNSVILNEDYRPPPLSATSSQFQQHSLHQPQHQQFGPPPNAQPHQHQHQVPPALALSPSTRALQTHAPGQSLPQGLAAGYSRIHALPPPPSVGNLPSPSMFGSVTSGGGGIGVGAGVGPQGAGLGLTAGMSQGPGTAQQQQSISDWIGMSPGAAAANGHSILSGYGHSSAGARGSPRSGAMALPGMGSRQASVSGTGKSWAGIVGGSTGREGMSPLSGPVVNAGSVGGDDDNELFVLDS